MERTTGGLLTLRGLRSLRLRFDGLIGEGVLLRLSELQQLRHLDLGYLNGRFLWTGGNKRGQPVQFVDAVVLRDRGFLRVEARTGDSVGVDDRVVQAICEKLPGLHSLEIPHCTNVTAKGVAAIARLKHLSRLDLSGCTKVPVGSLVPIVERSGWIELGLPLESDAGNAASAKLLAALAKAGDGLRELRLTGRSRKELDLAALGGHKGLRRLELSAIKVASGGLRALTDLRQLEELRILNCHFTFTDDLEFSRGLPPSLRKASFVGVALKIGDLRRALAGCEGCRVQWPNGTTETIPGKKEPR